MERTSQDREREIAADSKNMEQIAAEAGVDFLEGSEGSRNPGAVVAITIPSIEYPDEYKAYLPEWRQEFKEEGVVHCPNYKVCYSSQWIGSQAIQWNLSVLVTV